MKQPKKQTAEGKKLTELITTIKQKTGLTQEEIADRIKYKREYISQAKSDGSDKLYQILRATFRKELDNLTPEPKSEKIPVVEDPPRQYSLLSDQDIRKMIDSNHILALAIQSDAEVRKSLTDQNGELIKMVKEKLSERSPLRSHSDADATLAKVLVFVAQVASGKRWKSEQEALAAINIALDAPQNQSISSDIQNSDRMQRR